MLGTIKRELKNLRSPLYRNSIYISLSSLTTALAGFIFWAIAARLYPEGDVGVASAVVSALNLTFQLSMLGMGSSLIRFYPEYREKAMETALFVTTIASLVFSVGYGLLMMASDSFSGLSPVTFMGTFVLFSVVGTAYNIFFNLCHSEKKGRAQLPPEPPVLSQIHFSLRFYSSWGAGNNFILRSGPFTWFNLRLNIHWGGSAAS
ncbi:lipopolysaccharide biosynthesis protein [Thermococcus waiotapuensis]|uniref:Oligosaccharide flippase family protein n=1 Tax=Thermococcus waiotapuensis TaxID=90909 RepID=A0AAE4NWP5_9EURY|nr:oligosaccharide flippase family protein [Thermococcus waiotapuensis]MDV3104087.1 oligosaccharide flippase family protein [Thermococcus waiotapuensis]